MGEYVFVMRFENETNTLTAEKGISIGELGDILNSLSKAIGSKNEPLTLSKVRGNCYAFEISTPIYPLYESLKSVHNRISENDFSSLNSDQLKYAHTLNDIIKKNKYRMNVYDPEKTFNLKIEINKDELNRHVEFYYEVDDIYGIIASIGGKSIDSTPCVKLSKVNYEIYVNPSQENSLIKYFKKDKILFRIRKKIDVDTDRVVSAVLIDFEVLENNLKGFVESVNELKSNYKKRALFPKIKDSVESVRNIRGNVNVLRDE
jgi:hypothetical protein